MQHILETIEQAKLKFNEFLQKIAQTYSATESSPAHASAPTTPQALTREQYCRFLQMQYHLTRGVQRHFFGLAANQVVAKKSGLREWLIQFAKEEEYHFLIAQSDMKELQADVGEMPFDVKLWWLYYESVLDSHPFQRLGATCILENISAGAAGTLDALIQRSTFLNPKNLRFLTIHRHGPNLDHGAQILAALEKADLNAEEMQDVLTGAQLATVMYFRMLNWVRDGEPT